MTKPRTQWAVIVISDEAVSEAFGPFRSLALAQETWEILQETKPIGSVLLLEPLRRPTRAALERWAEESPDEY